MVFTAKEMQHLRDVYTPDIINLYYAFFFNFILWNSLWFMTKNIDPNPIPGVAFAVFFVLAVPRHWMQYLHEHDHVTSLPLYPFSLIAIALILSILPWKYCVAPAIRENDRIVKEENQQQAEQAAVRLSEGGVKTDAGGEDSELRKRKVRGHVG